MTTKMKKMNRNLTEEENSSQCLKILTQITIEDENGLAEREVFPKTINERIQFDNDNKLTLKSFFAFCSVLSQGQTEERWKRLLDRHSVRFPKYSVRNLQYGPKTRLIRGTYLKRGNTPEKISNIALMPFFFPFLRLELPHQLWLHIQNPFGKSRS